jgi:hypothetical protein
MPVFVLFGRLEIRVLDDPDKGEAGIVHVEPVIVRQAAIERERQARIAEIVDAPQTGRI